MTIILCDGSSHGNPGPASVGIIIWERTNNPRMIRPTKIINESIGVATNMAAEWFALVRAVRYLAVRNLFDEEIYIYSDSQTIVNQAQGEWKVRHENILTYFDEYVSLIGKFKHFHLSWIPRQLMYLADKAAQKGDKK